MKSKILLLVLLLVMISSAYAQTGAPTLQGDGTWETAGAWTIETGNDVTHADKTIYVNGNLLIQTNSNLSLDNVKLYMNSTHDDEYQVRVFGSLNLTEGSSLNSTQQSWWHDYYSNFTFDYSFDIHGGEFYCESSEIDGGYDGYKLLGIQLNMTLDNCTLYSSYNNGITFDNYGALRPNSSIVTIINSTLDVLTFSFDDSDGDLDVINSTITGKFTLTDSNLTLIGTEYGEDPTISGESIFVDKYFVRIQVLDGTNHSPMENVNVTLVNNESIEIDSNMTGADGYTDLFLLNSTWRTATEFINQTPYNITINETTDDSYILRDGIIQNISADGVITYILYNATHPYFSVDMVRNLTVYNNEHNITYEHRNFTVDYTQFENDEVYANADMRWNATDWDPALFHGIDFDETTDAILIDPKEGATGSDLLNFTITSDYGNNATIEVFIEVKDPPEVEYINSTITVNDGDNVYIENKTVYLAGHLYIKDGGQLTLYNTTLYMDCAEDHEWDIISYSGSRFIIDNSTILKNSSAFTFVTNGASPYIEIRNSSYLEEAYTGGYEMLNGVTSGNIKIANSTLGSDYGLYVDEYILQLSSTSTSAQYVSIENVSFKGRIYVGGENIQLDLVDCDLLDIDVEDDSDNGWSNVSVNNSLDLLVVDEDEQALAAEEVSITDALGSVVYTGDTDANGNIDNIILTWKNVNGSNQTIYRTPHTILVNGNNFTVEMYKPRNITIGTYNIDYNEKLSRAPNAHDFALTITDDTDGVEAATAIGNNETTAAFYDLLYKRGMLTERSAWVYNSSYGIGFMDQQPDYLDWLKYIEGQGFEISVHGITGTNSVRSLVLSGVADFEEQFGYFPNWIEHSTQREHIIQKEGSNPDGYYYIMDIINNSRYMWVIFDSVFAYNGKFRTNVEYDGAAYNGWKAYSPAVSATGDSWSNGEDTLFESDLPLRSAWGYSLEEPDINASLASLQGKMYRRDNTQSLKTMYYVYSEQRLEDLKESHDITIIYQHNMIEDNPPYDIYRSVTITIDRISSYNGWFYPTEKILDYEKKIESAVNLTEGNMSFTVDYNESDSIEGLTVFVDTNDTALKISQAKVGEEYLMFIKDNMIVVPQLEENELITVNYTLGNEYNASIPRIENYTKSEVKTEAFLSALYNEQNNTASIEIFTTNLTGVGFQNAQNFQKPFMNATTTVSSDTNSLLVFLPAGNATFSSVNMSVSANQEVNISVSDFDADYKKWTAASAISSASVTFKVGDLTSGSVVDVKKNSAVLSTHTVNSSGHIGFTYSGGFSTITFEVEPTSGTSSSEEETTTTTTGGTAAPATTASKTATFSNVVKGQELSVKPANSIIKITEIKAVSAEDKASAKITVKSYDSAPATVSAPPSGGGRAKKVYQYLDIDSDVAIKKAEIKFEVSDAWLEENEAEPDDVVLLHYKNEEWDELKTKHISGESYTAETDSFSTFAISAKIGDREAIAQLIEKKGKIGWIILFGFLGFVILFELYFNLHKLSRFRRYDYLKRWFSLKFSRIKSRRPHNRKKWNFSFRKKSKRKPYWIKLKVKK